MKVAVIGDTHFGCRSESSLLFKSQACFYNDVFFPAIDSRGIKTIVHLGDLVDRSKYAAFTTLNRMRCDFVDPIMDRGLELIIIPGNHDVPFKSSLTINAPRELLPPNPRIRIVHTPQMWNLYELPVLLLPWICAENKEASLNLIRGRHGKVIMGHLELTGFEMYRGVVRDDPRSLGASTFSAYDCVMSGHFHHKSTQGRIHYLGAPYQMEWNDYDCVRGFHVFDTATLELEFIPNPEPMFVKLFYDDGTNMELGQHLSGKFVKIVVKNRGDVARFQEYVTEVEKLAGNLEVEDDHHYAYKKSAASIMSPVSDTLALLMERAEDIEGSFDRGSLKEFLAGLYRKAEEMEA